MAEDSFNWFAPYASANDMVLVLPQAFEKWDVHKDRRMTGEMDSYFTNQDPQYLFIKNLIS